MDSRPKGRLSEAAENFIDEVIDEFMPLPKFGQWQPISAVNTENREWFLAKARDHKVPTVMRIKGPTTNYDDLGAAPKDWDIEARALNCGTHTWKLSEFTHWMPLPAPPED